MVGDARENLGLVCHGGVVAERDVRCLRDLSVAYRNRLLLGEVVGLGHEVGPGGVQGVRHAQPLFEDPAVGGKGLALFVDEGLDDTGLGELYDQAVPFVLDGHEEDAIASQTGKAHHRGLRDVRLCEPGLGEGPEVGVGVVGSGHRGAPVGESTHRTCEPRSIRQVAGNSLISLSPMWGQDMECHHNGDFVACHQ